MGEISRCGWVGSEKIYIDYHDDEWGIPEWDSRALWEKLILDGFQAGLSWITILKKRESFQSAFAGFEPEVIAQWGETEVAQLLKNQGIIRHRGKIEGTIKSARAYLKIQEREGFANFIWGFQDGKVVQSNRADLAAVPSQSETSISLSKALKKEGFTFVGPTIVYAFMQAVGMVNDHVISCPCHVKVAQLKQSMPAL